MTIIALQQHVIAHLTTLSSRGGGVHGTGRSVTNELELAVAQGLPKQFDQEMIQTAVEQFAGSMGFLIGGGIIFLYLVTDSILGMLEDDEETDSTAESPGSTASKTGSGSTTTSSGGSKTAATSSATNSTVTEATKNMTSTAANQPSSANSTVSATTGGSAATDGGVRSSTSENNLLEARKATTLSTTETAKSTVVRTQGQSNTPPLGRAETYELRRADGTKLAMKVAPVLGTGTDTLAHDDGSVLETLGELVDAAERADVSLAGADSGEYADDLAEEYGLWIHDVSRTRGV
jgi:hypothetical protein